MQPRARHRLATSSPDDARRMARRVMGRSTGIVLSGGGARGVAHLGVLEVLRDEGTQLDRIGGTSMGALVAALFAAHPDARRATQRCRTELIDRRLFRDYTWPRNALIRGVRARAMLERLFGDAWLEDLELDCFTVSADLGTAEVVVQRSGPIVEAVGASMSLPGLAPPVRSAGRLLVDGGVLNNAPVDVMVGTHEGPVIAVDVMTRLPLGTATRLPSIVETLARATVIGSHSQADARLSGADLVIAPDVGRVGLLEFDRFDELVEAGRRAAREALESVSIPASSSS
jgi:predicted acylesterase/phospholipase RssA